LTRRDLKPANLLISERLYIKLGDLGLAKRLGSSGKAFTTVGGGQIDPSQMLMHCMVLTIMRVAAGVVSDCLH
jgi:serine/threonine protein kinase